MDAREITSVRIPSSMPSATAHRIRILYSRLSRGTVSKNSRFSGRVNSVAASEEAAVDAI